MCYLSLKARSGMYYLSLKAQSAIGTLISSSSDHNVSASLARIVQVPAPTANNSDTCGVFFVIKKYKML